MLRTTRFLLGFIWLLCAAASATDLPPLTHGLNPIPTAPVAPHLSYLDMDDVEINLPDLAGQVVIVNFWATWCPPCRREMSSLEKLRRAFEGEKVSILAVNIGEEFEDVFTFLGSVDPEPGFKVLFDHEARSMQDWAIRGLPSTFIVTPDGRVRYRAVGGREFDHPDIVTQIRAMLKGASG